MARRVDVFPTAHLFYALVHWRELHVCSAMGLCADRSSLHNCTAATQQHHRHRACDSEKYVSLRHRKIPPYLSSSWQASAMPPYRWPAILVILISLPADIPRINIYGLCDLVSMAVVAETDRMTDTASQF
jgi:hypothetical protein